MAFKMKGSPMQRNYGISALKDKDPHTVTDPPHSHKELKQKDFNPLADSDGKPKPPPGMADFNGASDEAIEAERQAGIEKIDTKIHNLEAKLDLGEISQAEFNADRAALDAEEDKAKEAVKKSVPQ